ncbi:hypothetical protein AAHA92_10280 [Salvia divinorum]|uniref:Uncharacterized protein n=1 Tax=Salvia divinorum TaxID=28513 RepID=A0ABD1HU45_SALDI
MELRKLKKENSSRIQKNFFYRPNVGTWLHHRAEGTSPDSDKPQSVATSANDKQQQAVATSVKSMLKR